MKARCNQKRAKLSNNIKLKIKKNWHDNRKYLLPRKSFKTTAVVFLKPYNDVNAKCCVLLAAKQVALFNFASYVSEKQKKLISCD